MRIFQLLPMKVLSNHRSQEAKVMIDYNISYKSVRLQDCATVELTGTGSHGTEVFLTKAFCAFS